MRRPAGAFAALAAAAAIALAGCGAVPDVVAQQPGHVAATPAPKVDPRKGRPVPDPDAGLSDAERTARYEAGFAAFQKRLAEWTMSDWAQSLDPRALPRSGKLVSYVLGYDNLAAAVANADLAVLGTVEKIRFVPLGSLMTFRVERVAKGEASPTVTVGLGMALGQGNDWNSAVLEVDDNVPVLLAGDRAVLLLQHSDGAAAASGESYHVQSWSGGFTVAGGRVKALELCQFHDADGLTPDALMDRIARYA